MNESNNAKKLPRRPSGSKPPRPNQSQIIFAALMILGSACTATRPPGGLSDAGTFRSAPRAQKILNPSVTMPNGAWLGGDVAASIPVNDTLRVWLFGDTLVGSLKTECPAPLTFCNRRLATGGANGPVHNSVGILRGSPGSYQPIERFWGEKPNGEPTSFFPADKPDHYLWPLSGVPLDGGLVVLANENSSTSGLSAVAGVLLHVRNPLDPPPQWEIRQRRIPFRKHTPDNPTSLSLTSAVVHRGDFLILIGSRGSLVEGNGTILARLPVSALKDFESHWPWEWWMNTTENGPEWSSPLDIEKLVALAGLPGSSESSIDQNQDQLWETYQIPIFSYDIHRFTADALEGPWKDNGSVYQVPPPWSVPARRHCRRSILRSARTRKTMAVRRQLAKNPLCLMGNFIAYAPKSHPGLGAKGEQTLTYNVNLFFGNLKGLVHAVETFPEFYVPRVVRRSPTDAASARNR
jgi:hypothetical protein